MRVVLLLALVGGAAAQANAVNKIVGLLQGMQKTVDKEGAEATRLWEEHSEWFRSEKQATEYAIGDATDALEAANACAAETAAKAEQAAADIADLATKLAKNEQELDKATALREEENKDFLKAQQELVDTIDTLVRAASIIRRATGGSVSSGVSAKLKRAFAQVAASLDVVVNAAVINTADRAKLSALLQAGQQSEEEDYVEPTAAAYSEHSTSIVDLLTDLKQKAETELSELRKDESDKQHAFDMLHQSLSDASKTASSDKDRETSAKAAAEEKNAKCTGQASEESAIKSESEAYLAKLTSTYSTATEEYDHRTADRAGELTALAKAIEILQGAGGSFERRGVFVQTSQEPDVRQELSQLLRGAAKRLACVELAQLASAAMEDPFAKVKGLIADMIDRLQKQAAEEADHKAYCDTEKKKNEAKRDDRSAKLENYSTRLESANAESAQLDQDVRKLSSEIAASDAGVSAATKIREEENAAFNALMEDSRTGLEALSQAISVLKEYYGSARAHEEKSDSSNNVIAFLETAQSDMIKMKTDGQEAETQAAEEFTAMTNEQAQIRASKTASSKGKEQEKARLGSMISDLQNDVEGTSAELDATLAYLTKLKGSCVHEVESFEDRAAKMQQEIASLNQALDILENETAGESFLQRVRRH